MSAHLSQDFPNSGTISVPALSRSFGTLAVETTIATTAMTNLSTVHRPAAVVATNDVPPIADHIAHLPEADFVALMLEWRRQSQAGAVAWDDDRMVSEFLTDCSRSGSPLTRAAYQHDLKLFRRHLAATSGNGLAPGDPQDVRSWVAAMKADVAAGTLSKRTVNRRIATVSGFYKFASDVCNRAHTGVPCSPVPRKLGFDDPKTRVSALGVGDTVAVFLAARCSPKGVRDELLCRAIYLLGVRASEFVGMRRSDIEPIDSGARVTVRKGKGGKTRTFAINADIHQVLLDLMAAQPESEWLVVGRDPSQPMTRQALGNVVRNAGQRAGVRCWTHRMRHNHAEHAYQRRGDLKLISATLGHSSIAVTGDLYLDETRTDSSCNALLG